MLWWCGAVSGILDHAIRIRSEADMGRKLAGGPAIFLSASVPYERKRPADMGAREWAPRARRNREYLKSAEPAQIRAAVVAMTRAMLTRGMRLVFGAHPAISPMVLAAARDMQAPAGSIVIFQSEWFLQDLPNSTLELAAWQSGVLVLTSVAAGARMSSDEKRSKSLAHMREMMVSVPKLRGAIFVGGMEGVADEANIFRARHPEAPMYAVASTGSSARELWGEKRAAFSGTLADPEMLALHPSYSVVAHSILDDMKIDRRPYV
jgi:hypothetical protein